MTEEEKKAEAEKEAEGKEGEEGKGEEKKEEKKEEVKVLATLEALAKENPEVARILQEREEATNRLTELEKSIEGDKNKAKLEQGKFQELYEETLNKYNENMKEVEKNKKILSKYIDSTKQILAETMKTIPEENRSLIPSNFSPREQLEYISTNARLLGAKVGSNKGSGVPENDESPTLNEEQKIQKEVSELMKKENKTSVESTLLWEKSKMLKEIQMKRMRG